ncbi:MAG: hypothetical protein MUF54_07525 [Polyangiaceae bacterium]|jgi:hypothetical protein|nr:hypothetical protein [Polyangiaceae bacterium]
MHSGHVEPTRRYLLACLLLVPVTLVPGCKNRYVVGDHVLVEWEDNDYPAVIIAVEGPARYRVHYDGYDSIWDETVNVTRVKGRVAGPIVAPPPPSKVIRRGGAPAATASGNSGVPSRYRQGERVRVTWHGEIYAATIVEVLGSERYRVHYEGFGPEWDETIDVSRIRSPR